MILRWTTSAERDLVRLHTFLATINPRAAAQVVRQLIAGTEQLRGSQYISNRLSLPKGRKVALSFRSAVEKYLIKLDEEGGKDLIMKRRRFSLHLVPFFGDAPLSKISGYDVERYKKKRLHEIAVRGGITRKPLNNSKEKTTSPGTVNRELAALSHLFNKAIEWGWIDRRPATIKRFKEEQGRITYLSIDQIKRLIECAKQDQNAQIYPFIIIGLETSMRRMEIAFGSSGCRSANCKAHFRPQDFDHGGTVCAPEW